MANNILKIKRGSGNPGANLSAYELGWDTSTNSLFIGNGTGSTLIANSFGSNLSLDSDGNLTLANDLQVNGSTTLGDGTADSTTIRGTVDIGDSTLTTTIKGLLNVDEATTFDTSVGIGTTLDVTGLSSLDGGIDVNSSNFTVSAGGNIETVGNLTVGGNTALGNADTDTAAIRGTLTLSDSTKVTTIQGSLNVDEAATFDTTVGVTGNTTLGGGTDVTNTVRGTVNISDSTKVTTIKGTLNVDEAVTLDSTLGVTGNTTLSGSSNTILGGVNISSTGLNTNIKGTLNVDEAATFDTTVGVTGATTLSDTLDVVGDVEIGTLGDAAVTIEASTGNIATAGNMNVGGNLVVQGTTTTVESTVVTIADPVFTLGYDTTQDFKDRGIEFKYNDGAEAKAGFFGWDESTDKFTFIADATNSTEVFSGDHGEVVFADIYQLQTDNFYDAAGSMTNASAKWNKTYDQLKDGIENAASNEILQYDGTEFIATTSPSGLTIDCGTY